jgi:hypothetical protein
MERDFIISINESLLKISHSMGQIEGKVDNAIDLHTNCPARLGFEELKNDTRSIKIAKKEKQQNEMNSLSPAMVKSLQPFLFRVLPWIITALLAGAAFVGYMIASSDNSEDMIKKIVPSIPANSADPQ